MYRCWPLLTILFMQLPIICIAAQDHVQKHDIHEHEHGHDHEHDHEHNSVGEMKPAEMYAPSVMPDRVVLTLNEDPRTTQTVTWRTSVDVATALAQIAPAEAGPYFPKNATQHVATSEALKSDLNTAHYHSLTFRDLQPGCPYVYRVGDGVNWTEWFQFETAPEKVEPFSFVYFGDAQNDVRSMWSRVIRQANRDAPKAAFMLHAGDLVDRADSDAHWGEWFGAGSWLNAMIPVVAIPGNHEHVKVNEVRKHLTPHWQKVFSFPKNGPRGLEETCYTLTYQNLRIIGMNTMTMHAEQALWLEGVLATNESPWVVCTFHHPIYSTAKKKDDNVELRALWKPIFDKYQVDLVLQGHDHTYGRTKFQVPKADSVAKDFPLRDQESQITVGDENEATGVQVIDKDAGTVYVVSVSGPKMYNNTDYAFMKRVAEDTQLYQIIHIEKDQLRFEARTAIGELYDAFELHKREGEINELIELEPEVEENNRPEVEVGVEAEVEVVLPKK